VACRALTTTSFEGILQARQLGFHLGFRMITASVKNNSSSNIVDLKPLPQPRRRVLVVEDNLDSVHSMAALVRMMGHEVEFAINGFAALDIARKFRPDFVLLDIGLPDYRGDRIACQLKWEPGFENTRFIAITGLPLTQVRQRALDAGCEEVYAKPLDPAFLEQLLLSAHRQ
jgi:CheY-like chemotaxis protein